MKFFGGGGRGQKNNRLNFDFDPDHDPDPGFLKNSLLTITIYMGSQE